MFNSRQQSISLLDLFINFNYSKQKLDSCLKLFCFWKVSTIKGIHLEGTILLLIFINYQQISDAFQKLFSSTYVLAFKQLILSFNSCYQINSKYQEAKYLISNCHQQLKSYNFCNLTAIQFTSFSCSIIRLIYSSEIWI
ncbi:hypothetical protein TTHERM_000697259 (macronuclear) [Tetrahymena thermophila SB210]|uniref:Uncharacterized protein n=1 Tax=Tetrahymena thermophila (strain SB210) TaxID=312017 RepID=W7XFH0_TETTS|nr:hypothetical protein TTHERM_000697259 [Tetrahymena thermophila SB210]EWS71539.1 hypothetical protein TTHERM_000697259 [Tetrahymena thermophila SB210]|eukprot:XP_012655922.1 hypothetical protein TTHERM_000697259 [Tetrahymena thermophila SB210]